MSAASLARRKQVKPQSVAHALSRLEEMRLIYRAPHPEHGRVMRNYLTDAGRAARDRSSAVLADIG